MREVTERQQSRIVRAAIEYGAALAERQRISRERLSHKCEVYCPETPTGNSYPIDVTPGEPYCWEGYDPRNSTRKNGRGIDKSEWCEPCQKRDALWMPLCNAKAAEKRALERLRRAALKAVESRQASN